ncbi:MAG TPA: NUDIX hydrolase, partial [bacterium]|nr:NUDIX hydrolase [bacterium]
LLANNPNRPVDHYDCEACGFIFWQNSKPTASAIICKRTGEILLTQRAIQPYAGWWDLPGGFLKNGEDPVPAVQRELREELHMEIEVSDLLYVITDQYGEQGDYTLNLFYRATPLNNPQTTADDVSAYDWFSPHRLPERIAFRCVREALSWFVPAIIEKG